MPASTLFRETPCEHGSMESHYYERKQHSETCNVSACPFCHPCPGGVREEVTIDYEAATEMFREQLARHWGIIWTTSGPDEARAVIDAALSPHHYTGTDNAEPS